MQETHELLPLFFLLFLLLFLTEYKNLTSKSQLEFNTRIVFSDPNKIAKGHDMCISLHILL